MRNKQYKICYSYLPYGETVRFHKIEYIEAESIDTALFVLGAIVKGNDCDMESDPDYSPIFHLDAKVKIEWCYDVTEYEAKRILRTIVNENENG